MIVIFFEKISNCFNLSLCEMALILQHTSVPHRSGFLLYSPPLSKLSDSVTLKVDEVMKSFCLSCKVFVHSWRKECTLDDFK